MYRNWWFFLLVGAVYFITAYNSLGYYHADEHYQIIEFANYKLGDVQESELPWEFEAQMRPTLQVWVAVLTIKALAIAGINDPYIVSFLLRLITVFLCLFTLLRFYLVTKNELASKYKTIYLALTLLLWFIPFLGVRFSSETWSGLLFMLGLTYFQYDKSFKIAGILLGASILCRLQIIFAILPFLILILADNNKGIKNRVNTFAFVGIAILIGIVLDSFYYEGLVFSQYNYFRENIIKGMASGFGTEVWYFYFIKMVSQTGYLIGTLLIISSIYILIKDRKNIYNWCLISFILFHTLLSHKEVRFLFPIAFFIPYILTRCLSILSSKYKFGTAFWRSINITIIFLLVLINGIGVFAMSQKAAGIGRMEITKYIHQTYKEEKVDLYATEYANPYNPWGGSLARFYYDANVSHIEVKNLEDLANTKLLSKQNNLFVCRGHDMKKEHFSVGNIEGTKLTESIPKWVQKLNEVINGFDNHEVLHLYKLTTK